MPRILDQCIIVFLPDMNEGMKEVSEIMGGEILELESERLLRVGREEGREEGQEELAQAIHDIKDGLPNTELLEKYDQATLDLAYSCI